MSAQFNSRASRSRSPAYDYGKRSMLAKVDKTELTKLKVAIKRSGIIAIGPNVPLERGIDDPSKICNYVHVRKGDPPRVPIFGRDIKVNQDFSEDRTVFTHEKHNKPRRRSKSRSKSRSDRYRSRSKDRGRKESKSKSRERSRSRYRSRRSRDRNKRRSTSRTRSISRYRSRSHDRRNSLDRQRHRDSSRERSRRSRSRLVSPSNHKPECPMYRSPDRRRRRSITPLRPGEYKPGHPDLALKNKRSRSRSRSPRNSSKADKSMPSTSRERRSPGRSRSRRTPSPYNRNRRRSRSRHRSPTIPMPGMDFAYYEGFPPVPMHPFRGRFPMIEPSFYPRMYPPNMMMPRMPMNPMMRMPIRPRWPIYNSGVSKPAAPKPASTITSKENEDMVIIEHVNDEAEHNEGVSSSDRQEESLSIEPKKS